MTKEIFATVKLTQSQVTVLLEFVNSQLGEVVNSPISSIFLGPIRSDLRDLASKLSEAKGEFADLIADAEARAEIVAEDDIPF